MTEAQWALLLTLLPARKWRPGGPGRPPCDLRRVLKGIWYLLKPGGQWRRLPREVGTWNTVSASCQRGRPAGVWAQWREVLRQLERRSTWVPPKPDDILELAKKQQGRLVQSGEQLLVVLLESLQRLEQRLQGENSQAESLWNQVGKTKWKPKDENWFSSYVEDHLRRDLTPKGVVVNREVVIRRSTGNLPGERVDIQVDAISKKPSGEEYDRISVVIEVKGCWHKELNQAMKTQLIDRYLNEARCKHGLYLIGWFNCPQWSTSNPRKKKALSNLEEARKQFNSQANELSQSDVLVKAFVMNTVLR